MYSSVLINHLIDWWYQLLNISTFNIFICDFPSYADGRGSVLWFPYCSLYAASWVSPWASPFLSPTHLQYLTKSCGSSFLNVPQICSLLSIPPSPCQRLIFGVLKSFPSYFILCFSSFLSLIQSPYCSYQKISFADHLPVTSHCLSHNAQTLFVADFVSCLICSFTLRFLLQLYNISASSSHMCESIFPLFTRQIPTRISGFIFIFLQVGLDSYVAGSLACRGFGTVAKWLVGG